MDRASFKQLTQDQLKCYDILRLYFFSQAFCNFQGRFVSTQDFFNSNIVYNLVDNLTVSNFSISEQRKLYTDLSAAEQRLSFEKIIKLNNDFISFNPQTRPRLSEPSLEALNDEDVQFAVDRLVRRLKPETMCIRNLETIRSLHNLEDDEQPVDTNADISPINPDTNENV